MLTDFKWLVGTSFLAEIKEPLLIFTGVFLTLVIIIVLLTGRVLRRQKARETEDEGNADK